MSETKTPSPRTRVTRPDTAAIEGPTGVVAAEPSSALETEEETPDTSAVEASQSGGRKRGRGPYHSDGPNVFDSQGRSICVVLDGDLDVRGSTAAWIAERLNA
jgi:hypothetical protein